MVEFIKMGDYVVFGFFNGIEIVGCLDNYCCCGNDVDNMFVYWFVRFLCVIVVVYFVFVVVEFVKFFI